MKTLIVNCPVCDNLIPTDIPHQNYIDTTVECTQCNSNLKVKIEVENNE